MKIDVAFSAVLQKSPSRGGWTYVVWPKSAGKRVDVRLEERLAR